MPLPIPVYYISAAMKMIIGVTASICSCIIAAQAELLDGEGASRSLGTFGHLGDDIHLGLQMNLTNPSPFETKERGPCKTPAMSFIDQKASPTHPSGSGDAQSEYGPAVATTRTSPLTPKSSAPLHMAGHGEFASVVKIFVDSSKADFVSPWQMTAQVETSGWEAAGRTLN